VIKLPKQKMGDLLDQPIPPMVKSSSYADVDLPDCLVRVKGFSPIRINKYGEKNVFFTNLKSLNIQAF